MNAMDAQVVVSALIEKLQNESTSTIISDHDPTLDMQVHTAINKLNLLKQRLKLAEDLEASPTGDSVSEYDHVQRMVKLLQAVYSAENTADTLLTREAFEIKTKISGSKKSFRWPFATSMCSHQETRHKTTTFEDEFRGYLSSYDRMLEMTDILDVAGNNNKTESSSQQSDLKDQQSQRWGRISDHFWMEEETDVVGFEELKTKLVDLGLARSSAQVIAVVGEGGSGITTLVRTVYNKLLAKREFDGCAWVHVPSMFKARYVLSDILKQVKGIPFVGDATLPEESLIKPLAEILENQRCLIVIEDVESPQVWEALCRGVIPPKDSRTTIVITTHNEDVARYAARSILKVRRLNTEESWKLFLNMVPKAQDHALNKSDKLIKLKEQILKVCDGLPLKIVLLGGLLSSEELSYDKWSRVIERANNLKGDILALSYQDLPSQLKPCFLYLGLFPRGFEIHVRRLIHLWVSEGFVTEPLYPAMETTIREDLAEMYLEELVSRNMIQVKWRLDGSRKTCRMSGVLHDIFSPRAAGIGFFHHRFHSSPDTRPKFDVRRLATRLGIKNHLGSSFLHFENLRSYVAFDTRIPGRPAIEIGVFLNKIMSKKGFGLLKVLDLEGVYRPELSDDAIGKLFLLSYLGLRSTAIDSLPSSVATLPCLETLDVKHTIIHDLPTSIWQAKKLLHLYLNWGCSSSNFRSSLLPSQPPNNLHTLWGLSVDEVGVLGSLKTLTGLRKLGLTCTSESTAGETAKWVSELAELRSLKLRSIRKESNGNEIFELKLPTMRTFYRLQDLYLLGRLQQRSLTNIEFPPNLRMLTLSGLQLDDDPMPVLEGLPHLHILRLFHGSYGGNKMKCSGEGFPKLRVLKLWNLRIDAWEVEEGAMPYLREIEIRKCELLYWTTGLQNLTTLKKVTLINPRNYIDSHFVDGRQERDLYIYKREE